MKKKFREITVKGVAYAWKIDKNCDSDGGMWLKIWLNKKEIYNKKVEYNFDSNDSIQVTPEVVRKRIIEMLEEKETKIDTFCGFDEAWRGKCKNLAVKNGRCKEHADLVCVSCDKPATHSCTETGQLVCGAPLCDDCEHTIASDGTNGNIGFYQTAPLPDGMKEHCKKTDQVNFSWIVISCCRDYPEMQAILDRYKRGEISYADADQQMNDFIIAKNKAEEALEKEREDNEKDTIA